MSFIYIILLIKHSLQEQFHFNSNIFGNKYCIVQRVHCLLLPAEYHPVFSLTFCTLAEKAKYHVYPVP